MIVKFKSTFAALIAVLILVNALATKLQFNVVLSDEELIAARVPQAQNSGKTFQWTKSRVNLLFRSTSGTLNSACIGTVCELQTNATDLFRSLTIGEIQRLLKDLTFSWDAPLTEQSLLLLLVWHEANIVDGVDYAHPITLYAKQISVGLTIGQLSESKDTQQEALKLVNQDGVMKLSTDASVCRLQLLDRAQYDPLMVVSARNGTCTWTTDYAGPATLNDKNVVIETTLYDVNQCEAADVLGFQHDVDALEVVFKSTIRSGFCVDQVLQNDDFPQLWYKKPTTERCVPLQGGLQKCRYSFEHTNDGSYGYRSGKKTLIEVISTKQPSLTTTSVILDYAQTEIELNHDFDTWHVDLCEAVDIQDPTSPQQLQIKVQSGTKVICDLSALKRMNKQDQFAIKLKGGIKETLPVLIQFIQPPENTSKHIVVVTEVSDFAPRFILIHQPVLTLTEPCVFFALPTEAVEQKFLARAIRVSENAFQCEVTPEIVAAGRTRFAIELNNVILNAEVRFIKKA